MCILSNQQPKRVVPIALPSEMSAKGRGGARNGAGRKRQIAEGTPQSNNEQYFGNVEYPLFPDHFLDDW